MNLKQLKEYLDLVNALVVTIGIPLAIWKYFKNAKQEKEKNGYMAFDSLDKEYQKICLDNPTLRISDIDTPMTMAEYQQLTAKDKRAISLIYIILVSTFERAYFLYTNNLGGIRISKEIKESQWQGWVMYMRNYKEKEVFKNAWKEIGDGFDTKFIEFFNSL
jgi:hypothetical protein